jgi:putative ABC transport system permease protein
MQGAGIEGVSTSYRLPNNIDEHSTGAWNSSRPDNVFPMYYNMADYDYVELFGIEIVEGRNFSRDFPSDAQGAFLVNEAAVEAAGWETPVGQEIQVWTGNVGRIVGVMKDFHMHSLHRPIEPVLLLLSQDRFIDHLAIKIHAEDVPATVDFVKGVMKRFSPDFPFEYSFFNEIFDRDYHTEQRMGTIFRSISVLAIVIACFGLFGLSTFAAEQRTKEIGIRKTLGASVSSVFTLLSKEFVKWVLISNLIAWPVAYLAAQRWLQNFSYRTQVNLITFVLSAIFAMIIAVVTVSYQSIRASMANPVDSLKYE